MIEATHECLSSENIQHVTDDLQRDLDARLRRVAVDFILPTGLRVDSAVRVAKDLVASGVDFEATVEVAALSRDSLRSDAEPLVRAMRCLKRRLSDVVYRQLVADAARAQQNTRRIREGTAGRLFNPARPTHTRSSTLRISHFPDPRTRRYAQTATP